LFGAVLTSALILMIIDMPTYKRTAVTAKKGVNFVRSIVENAGSLFHRIDQENDLGIDALVELLRDGKPLNHQIAVQIKSGPSYYKHELRECMFPVRDHRDYWLNYRLPVFGVVYIPAMNSAYWVDIQRYLRSDTETTSVRFLASAANKFDAESFAKLFVPKVIHEPPSLSLDEALPLMRSSNLDELCLAIVVLFRRYPNEPGVWDELVRCLQERPVEELPGSLVYYIAHIPWHGDICGFGEQLSQTTRGYARSLLGGLRYEDVVKLLRMIDSENSISRGSIGQSVHAIISSLPQAPDFLRKAARSAELEMFTRECAALILAIDSRQGAEEVLSDLFVSGSRYAGEILSHLKEFGFVNPY
jgi:hypothetical protein